MKKLAVLILFATAILAFPATAMADLPDTIRVGLTRSFANRYSINIGNTYIMAGYDNNGSFDPVTTLHSSGGFTVRVTGGLVALYSGGQRVFSFADTARGAQIVDAHGGTVRLGTYEYRGAIEFRPSGGRITAINVLCPEQYLYGVLPREMYASFHINALKAQAIAARTFMVYRMNGGRHQHQGFHLCDTTHCQAYSGVEREHENTTRAVRETAGLMMFYNNTVILAAYFASCGGSTDNSEKVWVEVRPYLRAARSISEYNGIEWERTFTMAQLTTALQSVGANIGTATGMSITGTSPYGRVRELTIHATGGQWRVTSDREGIRQFFAPIGGILKSQNFHIAGIQQAPTVSVTDGHNVINGALSSFRWLGADGVVSPAQTAYVFDGTTLRRIDPPPAQVATGNSVTLIGRGWGHGVGMSQRGAQGMALLGFCYREILLHYYTGVEIR